MAKALKDSTQPAATPRRARRRSPAVVRARPAVPSWDSAPLGLSAFTAVASAVGVLLVLAIVGSAIVPAVFAQASDAVDVRLDIPTQAVLPPLEQRSSIYAADGTLLAVLDREVSRTVVELDAIPLHVRQAVITAEDRKFYQHRGYDPEGIARALLANARARGIAQGGSTITQQLAKTAVGTQRTVERKISELAYAVALERRFPKDALLERYLNLVYFGARAYGIAAAAEEYFGVTPDRLTVDQAALLAGLIRSPNTTDPRARPDAALQRRNRILADMVTEGYVPAADLPALVARPLGVVPPPQRQREQPHVVDAVQREFLATEAFGATVEDRERLMFSGGLAIHTTLDPRLQGIAEAVVADHFPPGSSGPTAAVAAVQPVTGEVLAIHGGLEYGEEQYDLASQGRRQPGSAFKPFVYAQALQLGFPLSMKLVGSSPTYFDDVPGWTDEGEDDGVKNYGNANYGPLDLRSALVRSVNTAAAQLVLMVGHEQVKELAGRMGIDVERAMTPQDGPAIALGGLGYGVTPLEMASAYSTFANQGIHVRAHLIDHVTDHVGNVVYEAPLQARQVLDPVVNAAMVDIMQDVVRRGTGQRARLAGWDTAGKTGTTQDSADAWFVGYTPVLSAAVWMGHPAGRVPMRGVTGGSLPATMWRQFMTRALEGREPQSFPDVDFSTRRITSGELVAVPDVKGMQISEALLALGKAKLVGEVRLVYSRAQRGLVLWQSPRDGRDVRAGTTVVIGVASDRVAAPRATASPSAEPTPSTSPTAEPDPDPQPQPQPQPTAQPQPQPTPTATGAPSSSEKPGAAVTARPSPSPDDAG